LTRLDLSQNQISDISPLLSLTNLERLYILEGSPLSDESLDVLIPQLKDRGVDVR